MSIVLGVCSLCGGPVTIPDVWFGINTPTPTCEQCGAIKKPREGRIIEMIPNPNDTRKLVYK